jgi:hypothetical protein
MSGRVLKGMAWGLGMAMLYSAYAIVLATVSGPEPFDKLGVTLETVVMTYLLGGVVAGAIVGALLPLRRTAVGRSFVGFVAAVPVFIGIFYAMQGNPARWDSSDWEGVVVISVAFGIAGGRMLRKDA